MDDRQQLARYQAALLDALDSRLPIEDVAELIRQLASETGHPDHAAIDPRMVATAMQLTRRWGVKRAT